LENHDVTFSRWMAAALVLGACVQAAPARQVEDESILEPIAWIDQQASLVHSARAEFTVTYLATTPAEMERISSLCRQRGHDYRAGSYYISAHQARRRSYHVNWFRKGVREREEKTYIARPAIVETTVFDGQAVRSLDGTPGRSCLYINSPGVNWFPKHRIQPFAFAFEFRSLPHGTLIRESADRRVDRHVEGNQQWSELVVRHPTEDHLLLRLVFDGQHRLLERETIFTRTSHLMQLDNEEPAVYSRHEFSDYKPYDDGHGKRIWFPSKAVLRYYLGKLPDGTGVQTHAIAVDVRDIEFNAAVPDEKFAVEAPEGVPVYDRRHDSYVTVAPSY
jgi:hypothetical protein